MLIIKVDSKLEEWLKMYEKEAAVSDIESYLDEYRGEKRVFTETFFKGDVLVESNPKQVWGLVDRLWAVQETRQLGNPGRILEFGTKEQVAKQMWYMVKGAIKGLTANNVIASGPFAGIGESMRTEILFKIFPQTYPVKNWKSEVAMLILFGEIDFVNGDYELFINYADRVLIILKELQNVRVLYERNLAYAFLDHFLGNYMYWHEMNQALIALFKSQYGHDLSP